MNIGKFVFGSTCFSAGFFSGVITTVVTGGLVVITLVAIGLDESEDKETNDTGVR